MKSLSFTRSLRSTGSGAAVLKNFMSKNSSPRWFWAASAQAAVCAAVAVRLTFQLPEVSKSAACAMVVANWSRST